MERNEMKRNGKERQKGGLWCSEIETSEATVQQALRVKWRVFWCFCVF